MNGLECQLEALRTKWPQAHAVEQRANGQSSGFHMIFLPGMLLPKGWNKTICTVFWLARVWGDKLGSPLDGFFTDLSDLRLANGAWPQLFRPFATTKDETIVGFPQWRDLSRFWWRQQMFDPNRETLYTSAMLIRQRLNPAR